MTMHMRRSRAVHGLNCRQMTQICCKTLACMIHRRRHGRPSETTGGCRSSMGSLTSGDCKHLTARPSPAEVQTMRRRADTCVSCMRCSVAQTRLMMDPDCRGLHRGLRDSTPCCVVMNTSHGQIGSHEALLHMCAHTKAAVQKPTGGSAKASLQHSSMTTAIESTCPRCWTMHFVTSVTK